MRQTAVEEVQPAEVRPEGWAENRLVLPRDPWPDLYAAMAARARVDARVVGVEGERDNLRFVLDVGGVRGYLPKDEAGDGLPSNPTMLVGAYLACRIKACDRKQGCCLLERRSLVEEMAQQTWAQLEARCGELVRLRAREKELEKDEGGLGRAELRRVRAEIARAAPLWKAVVRWVGRSLATVDLGGVVGTLPRVEFSWSPPDHLGEVLRPGDCLEVKVIHLDPASRKVEVSRRLALPDPWVGAASRYRKGGVYEAKVVKVLPDGQGVLAELEPGLAILTRSYAAGVPVGSAALVEVKQIDEPARRGAGRLVRLLSRG